jgi:predicted AlkP superfamily pyrophosphatase or phosphodiesterase
MVRCAAAHEDELDFAFEGELMNRKFCGVACVVWLAAIALGVAGLSAKTQRPKLVVILVVDQMRADYVDRFGGTWTGGLHRLMTEGARFTNAQYPYSNTVTCAGHSTISTGDFPSTHGMIANDWYQRETDSRVTCVSDPKVKLIRYGSGEADDDGGKASGESSWRMQAPSLAEQIRAKSAGSRVVTMSLKARAAGTLAGHTGDAVTWMEKDRWVSSTGYEDARVPEVQAFVTAHPMEADAGKTWTATGAPMAGLSSEFPHALALGGKVDASFYGAWQGSPYSDAYLGAMAESLVDSMKLGQQRGVDVLGISFSALDVVGHQYGPDSAEIQDVLQQLDLTVGRLFGHLDKSVGRGNYIVALSADHGVAPLPELRQQKSMDSGRADIAAVRAAIVQALAPFGGGEKPIASFQDTNLYFTPAVEAKLKGDAGAMNAVIAAIKTVPGVADAFPGEALNKDAPANALAKAASYSYYADRSGDVMIITKPYWFFWTGSAKGTTHGSPYEYDQHVPLVVMGAGVKAKSDAGAATPADIAPTLAALAGIKIAKTDGHALAVR